MAVIQTFQVGNPVIRSRAKACTNLSTKERNRIITNLIDSMRAHELVGMAAPQIGQSFRIFVTEIRLTKLRDPKLSDPLRVFVDPRIVQKSARLVAGWEGCGSVARSGLFGKVKRHATITVQAKDRNGEPFTLNASGLLAQIIQHEIDHLNGIVFADKALTKTYMSEDEYRAMRKAQASG